MDVALVTGDASAASADAPLVAALTDRGVTVHRPAWTDGTVDWSRFDVAVVRTPWDDTADRDAFLAWATGVEAVTGLWNPADVLRWNTHRSYLLELEERGAPVVPTAWIGRGDVVDLDALLAGRRWDRAVVKPTVASGSDGLLRIGPDTDSGAAQAHLDRLLVDGDAMVQPYLARVETDGELSVVLVAGEVTHVVRKTPIAGGFRTQERHGGTCARLDLAGDGAEPAALARWVVEASGHDYLVARVDLLRADDGTLQLAALEVTEPDLHLTVAPEAAEPLADAIVARARRPGASARGISRPDPVHPATRPRANPPRPRSDVPTEEHG